MKEINTYITEKLHLNRNIKSNNKLSIVKWFDYFKENGLTISLESQYSSKYYYVHFPNKKFPKFEMRTEKILGRYRFWRNIASTSKNVPLIRVKDGGYEELMNSDELDKTNEDGKSTTYAFTIKNADIIINTLNKYK